MCRISRNDFHFAKLCKKDFMDMYTLPSDELLDRLKHSYSDYIIKLVLISTILVHEDGEYSDFSKKVAYNMENHVGFMKQAFSLSGSFSKKIDEMLELIEN